MEGDTLDSSSASAQDGSADISGSLRLLLHVKDNQVSYLIGLLVAHQMGILDKLWTYGSGVCV